MKEIKAIPTTLFGVHYKSRIEARWALFLTLSGIVHQYEPNGDDTAPDFKIEHPYLGIIFLEIKGQIPNNEYMAWLCQNKVDYVAVGGFFKQTRPIIIKTKTTVVRPGQRGKSIEQFSQLFPNNWAFIKASNHRFDL